MVLDLRSDDANGNLAAPLSTECADGALENEIVRLAATARENDLARGACSKQFGDVSSGLSEILGRLLCKAMDAARIADAVGEVGRHRFEGNRGELCCRGIIRVDVAHGLRHGLAKKEEPDD